MDATAFCSNHARLKTLIWPQKVKHKRTLSSKCSGSVIVESSWLYVDHIFVGRMGILNRSDVDSDTKTIKDVRSSSELTDAIVIETLCNH